MKRDLQRFKELAWASKNMSNDELETLVAAVSVKQELPVNVPALVRGMPKRHAVELSLNECADFILRRWQLGADLETTILENEHPGSSDKLRDDAP